MSIRFYPHRKKTIGEKHKIYCRITINRKKSEFYTGLAILPSAWDNEKRKTNNVDINAELSEVESKLFRIRRDLIDKDIPLTSSNIVDYYKGHKSTKFYILEYFDAHVQFIKNKGEHSRVTISQYGSTYKILIKFIRNHFAELSKRFEVHPNMISKWKCLTKTLFIFMSVNFFWNILIVAEYNN